MGIIPDKKRTNRHTQQRASVLQLVKLSTQPVSARDILAKIDMPVSTLYRNLEWLVRNGEIASIDAADGVKRYIGHSMHEGTFSCQRCGKTWKLTDSIMNDRVQRKLFTSRLVFVSRLMVSGVCEACARRLR